MCVKVQVAKIVTTLLVVMFGTSTWVALGGLWVELPLLTNLGVPEGYRIGCYVIIITQAAAIGPLLFVALQSIAPKNFHLEIPTIYVILTIGLIASFLLIFFWDTYTVWSIDQDVHSTAFLVLSFFMALVDSTSNLTFLPFVSTLRAEYVNWYFIGEGLSSVIPSLVVLIQGEGGVDKCVAAFSFSNTTYDPITNVTVVQNCTEMIVERDGEERFPPKYYYAFIFLLFLSSAVSFGLLRWLPLFRGQYVQFQNKEDSETLCEVDQYSQSVWYGCCSSCCRHHEDTEKTPLLTGQYPPIYNKGLDSLNPSSNDHAITTENNVNVSPKTGDHETSLAIAPRSNAPTVNMTAETNHSTIKQDEKGKMTISPFVCSAKYVFLFTILLVVSAATYGILPSIQSYSAAAYGPKVYLLVAAFAEISVPIGFFLVMIKPTISYLLVLMTSLGGLAAGSYCMTTAVLSPSPPLMDHNLGTYVIILAWILQGLLFSYCRATIGWILRGEEHTRVLLMLFGGCATAGTMIGAVIMFPLVNHLDIFQDFDPNVACPSNITCVTTEYMTST